MEQNAELPVCFIISHRYYRAYPSYIQYYVDNIQKMYSNNYIVIVDNNSKHLIDISERLSGYKNLIILVNNSTCKFEIGAYKIGIRYIYDNNMQDLFEYFIFTQDNFIIKNKYDFNILAQNKTTACAINIWNKSLVNDHCFYNPLSRYILDGLCLSDSIDKLSLCWCSSFVLHKSTILPFLNIVAPINITVRAESCDSERFLSGILYRLNNDRIDSIDGSIEPENLGYDCWTVDLVYQNIQPSRCFVKKVQQKNENTIDE
jgi:hypothetical protein